MIDELNGTNNFGFKAAKFQDGTSVDLSPIIIATFESRTQKIIIGFTNVLLKSDYKFDLDFVIPEDPERDISRNLGWMLGFKKEYYNFDENIVNNVVIDVGYKDVELDTSKGICVTIPGFQTEAPADFTGTKFFLIEIGDFNNNSIQSFYYPTTF